MPNYKEMFSDYLIAVIIELKTTSRFRFIDRRLFHNRDSPKRESIGRTEHNPRHVGESRLDIPSVTRMSSDQLLKWALFSPSWWSHKSQRVDRSISLAKFYLTIVPEVWLCVDTLQIILYASMSVVEVAGLVYLSEKEFNEFYVKAKKDPNPEVKDLRQNTLIIDRAMPDEVVRDCCYSRLPRICIKSWFVSPMKINKFRIIHQLPCCCRCSVLMAVDDVGCKIHCTPYSGAISLNDRSIGIPTRVTSMSKETASIPLTTISSWVDYCLLYFSTSSLNTTSSKPDFVKSLIVSSSAW